MPKLEDMVPLHDRLEKAIMREPNSGCWLWERHTTRHGYGVISIDGKQVYAHRVMYERRHGKIPSGLEIDHKCRTPACCNPDHLEAVTHLENVRRGTVWAVNKARLGGMTHCKKGHEFTPENTYVRPSSGLRNCRICRSEYGKERRKNGKQ